MPIGIGLGIWRSGARITGGTGINAPIFFADSQDVVYSGSNVSSWPTRVGPNGYLTPPMGTPKKASSQYAPNGLYAVQFDKATSDHVHFGTVRNAYSDYTFQIVIEPKYWTAVDREYILRATVTIDNDDLVIAHRANLSGGRGAGYYDGVSQGEVPPIGGVPTAWHSFRQTNYKGNSQLTLATSKRHVMTVTLKAGETKLYRNGVLVGSNTRYTRRTLRQFGIGGTFVGFLAGLTDTFLDAYLWRVRGWPVAFDASDVATLAAQDASRYSISDPGGTHPSAIWPSAYACYDPSDPYYVDYDDITRVNSFANVLNTGALEFTPHNVANRGSYDPECVGIQTPDGSGSYTGNKLGGIYLPDNRIYVCHALASQFTGAPAGPRSLILLFRGSTAPGETLINDKPLIGIGSTASNTQRHCMLLYTVPATGKWVRSQRVPDVGSQRYVITSNEPTRGTKPHGVIMRTNETGGQTNDITMDGITSTTGVLTTTSMTSTLDTFAINGRIGLASAVADNGIYANYGPFVVLIANPSAGERALWRDYCQRRAGAD